MAYIDATLQFSSGQTVLGSAPVTGTNVIDLTNLRGLDGETLYVVFNPKSPFAGLTSMACQLIAADDAGLTTNAVVLASTGQIPVAQLVPGKGFPVAFPPNISLTNAKRYVGVSYVPVGSGTAGTIDASIQLSVSDGMKPSLYGSSGGGFTVQ